MGVAVLCGAGIGLGLVLVISGLFPARPSLSAELARLRRGPERPVLAEPADVHPVVRRIVRTVSLLTGTLGHESESVRKDLRITESTHHRFMWRKVTTALFGFFLVPAMAAAMTLGGVRVPVVIPVAASVVLGAAGFFLPDASLRMEAAARRRHFSLALSSFLDLVAINLAGGAGPEGALHHSARIGEGWAFQALRQALERTRITGEPAWSAFGRLGAELGVPELSELAASLTLAGTEGAKVRESLVAKAESLRRHELAAAEAHAQQLSERMALPLCLLFFGFMVLVAYPAVARILQWV